MAESHSENTRRIAKNTLFLYGRMLFGMLVSLYTSRVILNALGVEDYGIYNVVGGFVAMFSLISGSLSAAISRFLTFELGVGDSIKLKRAFSTSFLIQAALSVIIILLGETIGIWFLNTHMTIPTERLTAANWIFQSSIVSFVCGLMTMPYTSCLVAHERMKAFAYLGIIDILIKLAIVLFIAYAPWQMDKLIVYAYLLTTVSIGMQIVYIKYCQRHFSECHISWTFDKEYWKSMSGFAGWNFIGASSALLRDQGGNILLNLFFGPVINASRGIAGSVAAAVGSFSGNFMTAINPQITKSYASGDHDYMISLIFRASRFGFYLMLIIAMPILFNTQYVLELWLNTVPPYADTFVTLTLIFSMCEIISAPLITAQLATGNIRTYQIVVGGLQMLNFPLVYIALKLGAEPYTIYFIAICISACCLIARLYFLRGMIGLPARRFCIEVVTNTISVSILSSIIPYFLQSHLPMGFVGLCFSTIICISFTCIIVLAIGCNNSEKIFIFNKISQLIHKRQSSK